MKTDRKFIQIPHIHNFHPVCTYIPHIHRTYIAHTSRCAHTSHIHSAHTSHVHVRTYIKRMKSGTTIASALYIYFLVFSVWRLAVSSLGVSSFFAWYLVLGAWCLVLGARCLALGALCSALGAWCLVLGA